MTHRRTAARRRSLSLLLRCQLRRAQLHAAASSRTGRRRGAKRAEAAERLLLPAHAAGPCRHGGLRHG